MFQDKEKGSCDRRFIFRKFVILQQRMNSIFCGFFHVLPWLPLQVIFNLTILDNYLKPKYEQVTPWLTPSAGAFCPQDKSSLKALCTVSSAAPVTST